jgi:GNAT superfamily N-acetyltransferase
LATARRIPATPREGGVVITAPAVRRAVDADAPKIAELLGELGYSTHPSFILERMQLLGARADDAIFVAESADAVVGVVAVHTFPAFHADVSIGRITALVVGAHHRRKGVGKLLLSNAESFAFGRRCGTVEVTSGGTHEPAPQFYESNGYEHRDQHMVKARP